MRVLMFGWEFPPRISGGLGTACFGLSQSLVQEGVKLHFVVPKLHGNEPGGRVHLINASKVNLPGISFSQNHSISNGASATLKRTPPSAAGKNLQNAAVNYLEVSASLDPYSLDTTPKQYGLEVWNYELSSGDDPLITDPSRTFNRSNPTSNTYAFTGTYGPRLFEEVKLYSKVGGQLGRRYKHDVIHAHDWMTYPAGIAAKKESGKPLVVHVHATEIDRSGNAEGNVYTLEKQGMEEADSIVAVSHWTKNVIINHYGIAPEKIMVIHNGILPKTDNTLSETDFIGTHVVTFLGRITHQKGPRYFIEAARSVLEKFPQAHFIVAGSGDLLPQTIERVAQLKISKNFHFTGFLDTDWIAKIWAMSDVYVMPSVSEPFGITPLEAAQAGVPVIVSNQSGVSEVLPHALKVNFWDTDALADAICSVLKHKSLSLMLRTKGAKEIERLTWSTAAHQLKKLYHELTT